MPAATAARATPVARAVVLYGRVGTYQTRTASLRKGMPGDEKLWRTCAESIRLHIVNPWQTAGRVDVFVQSWNPELAAAMDEFWQPRGSEHRPQNGTLGKCTVRLQYCDRTKWALLGMKRAVSLRSSWAASAEGRDATPHATVLVMRHDVIWNNGLPPLRADRSVRLWLPFDCHRAPCRDRAARASDFYAERPPPLESCRDDKRSADKPTNWTAFHRKTNVLGVNCAAAPGTQKHTFCSNSVNIDWWWAGDPALADGFGDTFDRFSHYSSLVRDALNFHNSAPHHYWGLYFFHTHRLRDKCQLGHSNVAGLDFTLGRFVQPQGAASYMQRSCKLHGWRAYWKPPNASKVKGSGERAHALGAGAHGTCNASLIPGYLTMCPGAPAHPVRKVCGATAGFAPNVSSSGGSKLSPHERAERKQQRQLEHIERGERGGGEGAAAEANATSARDRRRATRAGADALSGKPKSARDVLKDLGALRDDNLISEAEWASSRQRVLDALVTRAAAAAPSPAVGGV